MANKDVDKWIKNRKPHQVIPFSIQMPDLKLKIVYFGHENG